MANKQCDKKLLRANESKLFAFGKKFGTPVGWWGNWSNDWFKKKK